MKKIDKIDKIDNPKLDTSIKNAYKSLKKERIEKQIK